MKTTGEPNTPLYLTDEQIQLFTIFCKYYEPFKAMVDSKAFEINSGNATLHFKDSQLMQIEVKYQIYKRQHQQ